MDKYEVGSKLGSGGFATVYLGRRKADGKTVAIKKIECENFDDANQALTEGKMLLELDHTHVVRYYDFFLHQEKTGVGGRPKMFVVLVMSYAPNGDLFNKLERAHREQKHIPEETIRKWLLQLLQALEYVGHKRIIHRDVKLANVLLDGETLKLADFGIAKVMHAKFAQTIVGGTPCYMAPELLYKEKYDTKSDIWSLGCLIWELSTRSLLSQSKGVLGAQVLKDPSRLKDMWSKMEQCGRSQELIQAVKKMLAPELAERASARSLLELPMFGRKKQPAPQQTLGLGRAAGDATLAQQIIPNHHQQPPPPPQQHQPVQQQPQQAYAPQHQTPPAQPPPPREREAPAAPPQGAREVEDLCSEADKYQQMRDYERAERCFRKALAVNPKHCRSLCNYAYMLHVGKRDYAKSEELYRRALLLEPTRTATLCNYAYLLHSDKRMGEAREVFLRAYDTNPEHPWVRSNQHLFA
mmetsp:Transcript_38908/g.97425  ORF Transcript_38908/g.97425 Transcript_38908/m.97425 type:complete len:468 (+) Transcript_38908:290-1693(+)